MATAPKKPATKAPAASRSTATPSRPAGAKASSAAPAKAVAAPAPVKATAAKAPPVAAARTAKAAAPAAAAKPGGAFMKPMKVSADLAAVIGQEPMPRTAVTSKLWEYIKKHQLQDPTNKRMINADAKLRVIFGKDQVSMFEMTKLVSAHLSA